MKPQFLATLRNGEAVAEMIDTDEKVLLEELKDIEYVDLIDGGEDNAYRLVVDDYFMFHITGGIKLGFGLARQHKGTPIFERRGELLVIGYSWLMNEGQYKMKQVAIVDFEQGLVQMSVEGSKKG